MKASQQIRVLYCENNVDGTIGGSYYSLLYLLKGLNRSIYQPTVVFYSDHALVPVFRAAGIETLIWKRPSSFTFGSNLPKPLQPLGPLCVAARKILNLGRGFLLPSLYRAWFLRRRRVDLVHLNNSVLYNHDWMLAAQLARVKCVTHERGINANYPEAARFFGRRLSAVFCISDAVRQNMRERGADFGNLQTIHNGLDPQAMQQKTPAADLRIAYGVAPHTSVVVMVGNIKAWKGQETLIRAVDKARRVRPDITCFLVGDTAPADREYEMKLRALVAESGLDKAVVFAGFQRNVTDFIMMCDVVVHASVLPEPFGRVILEAMACRKPVIAARAGAIPEIIEEGESGLTFEPGDVDGLAAQLIRVIGVGDEARRLGENGYERLLKHFHVSRNIAVTEAAYERLLS